MYDNKEFKKFATKHVGINTLVYEDYEKAVNAAVPPSVYGMTPNVIEERRMNAVAMDVFSRLMMDRIIYFGLPVRPDVANVVNAQLLFLQSTDPKRDIQMFLNSPGGSVIDGLSIYDTMQYVSPDVATVCTGLAASMGAVLLAAGEKGKRSCLGHSRVMIHQPSGGMQGQASDMEISYKFMKSLQKDLYNILAKHTGQPYEKIEEDCDRDNWLSGQDALEYGLIDEVLGADAGEKK